MDLSNVLLFADMSNVVGKVNLFAQFYLLFEQTHELFTYVRISERGTILVCGNHCNHIVYVVLVDKLHVTILHFAPLLISQIVQYGIVNNYYV